MTIQQTSRDLSLELATASAKGRFVDGAQRRAWAYLWVAFAVWCTLVLSGVVGVTNWRRTSYTAPPAQLVSKRGIVLFQGATDERPVSISERADLEESGTLEVPNGSEATIHLGVDDSTIRVRSGSRMKLSAMRVGRFNRDLTQVRIEQLDGAANYSIAGELPDGREVEIRTPNTTQSGEAIKLTKGEYLVWVQPSGTRVEAYNGQAKAEVGGSVYRLRDGKWVVVGPERSDLGKPLDLPEHLIKNRDFNKGLGESWSAIDLGEKGRPDVGGQRSVSEESVNGQILRALRITRETAKDTHNETGLYQDVNRDVSAYRAVNFAAWVKVNGASLDGGGYAGSEYPLMFRVRYVAENGGTYTWAHGFYVKNSTNRPADLGELIPAGQWYRYTLDMLSLRERPAYIVSVEVLASGHDYDAQVANIQLMVE